MIKNVLDVCKEMLYTEPFYGSVLLTLKKEISNDIPTAGVMLDGISFKLLINPKFWNSLPKENRVGLIKHELGHLINFHLTEYNHLTDHNVANIAMDIYINQTIPKEQLPPNPCMWDNYKNLQKGMDTNWYYNELVKNDKSKECENTNNALKDLRAGKESTENNDGTSTTLPKHDWESAKNSSEAIKKIATKTMQSHLEEIVKNTKVGDVPGGVVEILEKLSKIEPPKFNWKAYVKNFIGVSTRVDVKKTNRKKSKRFPDMRGSREFYFSHILIAIDTSASFTKKELVEAQNEMHHLNKLGHDVTVVFCDTKMSRPFKFKPRTPLEIEGRGGTSFQPVINYYRENLSKYSCLIYFTDGEANVPKNPRGNILWVHSTGSNINKRLPGRKIKLN